MSDLVGQKILIDWQVPGHATRKEVDGFVFPGKDGLAITPAFRGDGVIVDSDGPRYRVTQTTTGRVVGLKPRPLNAAVTFMKFLFTLDVDWTDLADIEAKRPAVEAALKKYYRGESRRKG